MAQHYTLNTVEAAAFCRKCGKETMYKVEGRRLSYCMACMAKPLPQKKPEPAKQMTIEEVYGGKPV